MEGSPASRHAMMAESVAVRDLRPLSERMLSPLRRCPECLQTSFRDVDGELVCMNCGLVLSENHLQERGNDGFEQDTHSATQSLEFHEGKGRPLRLKQLYELYANNIVGDQGRVNMPARANKLLQACADKDRFTELVHPALEYGSYLLERLGYRSGEPKPCVRVPLNLLKHRGSARAANSSGQESGLGYVVGEDLGVKIRSFYKRLLSDLEALGYIANNGQKFSPFSIESEVVVENLLMALLLKEKIFTGDDRRVQTALGFKCKTRMVEGKRVEEWVSDPAAPRLECFDPKLMAQYAKIAGII